jgi:hypothetical protein
MKFSRRNQPKFNVTNTIMTRKTNASSTVNDTIKSFMALRSSSLVLPEFFKILNFLAILFFIGRVL